MELLQQYENIFWLKFDFWIFFILSVLSVIFSIKSFKAAKQAKSAAESAATTVKIQTITIELSEIIPKLDKLDPDIDFTVARDILNENNRRVRRLIAPFKEETEYLDVINKIIVALETAKEVLNEVKPIQGEGVVKSAVYYAIESHFSTIAGLLAELMGLFEKRTIKTT